MQHVESKRVWVTTTAEFFAEFHSLLVIDWLDPHFSYASRNHLRVVELKAPLLSHVQRIHKML